MNYSEALIERTLLETENISDSGICHSFSKLKAKACDWADIYIQKTISRDWIFEENRVKTGSFSIDKGVGVRGVLGENSFLSHTNEISDASILTLADTVASGIATSKNTSNNKVPKFRRLRSHTLYSYVNPTEDEFISQQLEIIKFANDYAKSKDKRVKDVCITYQTEEDLIALFRIDSISRLDARPMSYLSISVVVEENGIRERAVTGAGARVGIEFFSKDKVKTWIDSAIDEALHNLFAQEAPAGKFPVVLGPGWPGILLHEAIGHGLEADFIRKETSAFTKMLGKQIASSEVTIIDQGNIPTLRGSLTHDDEGTPTQETTLIENGILVGFITDILNAKLLGIKPTGNGRRESFASLPIPRMTNTFMKSGLHNPADIISSVDYGIYASNFNGGQVDITSGTFVFNMSRAWLIEKGKITQPIKGAMLVGSGAHALLNIKMVGNDSQFDMGTGQCGKDGQSVPVTVGMPTIRIDNLTVGGTKI